MNRVRATAWSLIAGLTLVTAVACSDGEKAQSAGGPDGRSGVPSVRPSGVYTVTTTHADLVKAGSPDEDVPENYGKWVYVFKGDRLAFTQENKDACTWAYGEVRFHGRYFDWEIIDGGFTKAPHNAYNKPGELFTFGMSVYRDTLTLSKGKGAISPENFLSKPWHRISGTPSDRYFSKNCPPPKQWTTSGKGA
ncbi:hypothetical protein GCM10011579_041830 [Streptomyces albiflavescens]|uniref:Lipoprotein n=1 Tax=Streptomyces albiflavescens TaxID=1623582 RepID=A0A918D5P8_9ACTN|nr:hypothetical protein [Streptomyces albiflavescens]GGN68379.1 hypothetical protein GCM10011579_041830 [Streptomyces albiflavescens]